MKWHTFQPEQSVQDCTARAFNLPQGSPEHDGMHTIATAADEKLEVEEEKPTRPLLTAVQGRDAPASRQGVENDTAAAEHVDEEAERALEVKARQVGCPL